METIDKLAILTDAAKYDVACTSSCSDRSAQTGKLGNTFAAGICHSFAADGRCISLLKVLYSNACIYDCSYCVNRRSNDVPRASFSPRELADLTIEFYRRNYIEGLFLSSGVIRNPDHTTELITETIRILRKEYGFRGYIHAKSIPGTSPELLQKLGTLVDRVSVNIELPSEQSLRLLAPDKERTSVLSPMRFVHEQIQERNRGICSYCADKACRRTGSCPKTRGSYAPAGQSTQMIVGASPESDFHILRLSESLYRTYDLKRVFFSAYLPINRSPLLPETTEVPLLREHRLYQADWLMRKYHFSFDELLSEQRPFLDPLLDPKCNWALEHLDRFPLEINTAPYEMLLRIPGIGVTGARKIVRARKVGKLTLEELGRLGVALKRAQYFITCEGRYPRDLVFDAEFIYQRLTQSAWDCQHKGVMQGQLSLWETQPTWAQHVKALETGQQDPALGAGVQMQTGPSNGGKMLLGESAREARGRAHGPDGSVPDDGLGDDRRGIGDVHIAGNGPKPHNHVCSDTNTPSRKDAGRLGKGALSANSPAALFANTLERKAG